MASITKHPNGRREVQFVGPDRKRRTVRLGKVDQKTAESTRLRIEELSGAAIHGSTVSPSTSQWLRALGEPLHDRLVRAGLCKSRVAAAAGDSLTLAKMIDDYITRRDDVKPATRVVYKQGGDQLRRHFGADRDARSITAAEAGDFRRSLRRQYSEAFTAKIVMVTRTFWRDAADRGLVDADVFAKVPAGSQVNVDRHRFVDAATVERVIAVATDPQWKLLLALSRYAGLRCPSEHLALRWSDVDWGTGRMTVRACKTEHHANRGIRLVPIFEPLRPYLRAVYDARDPADDRVITRYRLPNSNLRAQLLRLIGKAGLAPWPRLFHNLRVSCQTDLAERFPSHVVCRWIGNSEAVARDHYLQTTEAHFAKAVGVVPAATGHAAPGTDAATADAKSDAATGGVESQPAAAIDLLMLKTREILEVAKRCDLVQFQKWAGTARQSLCGGQQCPALRFDCLIRGSGGHHRGMAGRGKPHSPARASAATSGSSPGQRPPLRR